MNANSLIYTYFNNSVILVIYARHLYIRFMHIFYKKISFFVSVNFLKRMLDVWLRFLRIFFLNFTSLLSLIVHLVRFNNKLQFLTYMLTLVSNFTTYDGTTLRMKTEKIFK